MSVTAFQVNIHDATLDDLRARLLRTRSVPDSDAEGWNAGTNPGYLSDLVDHWRSAYDWRAQESRLNSFAHFKADIDGRHVHFIHERGRGTNRLPLILTHGFPDSFVRFLKLIPMLTHPEAHGGDAADAFDVVVPSLPGFAFSDKADAIGHTFGIGDLWHTLMTEELGYDTYGAHGGDWGATITEQLARSHSNAVVGIHLTDVPGWHSFQKPDDLSADEESFFARAEKLQMTDSAFMMIQGTRPQTLADGLNDSPAGLAAWIVEKFQAWSDCNGDVETRFTKDELLTNIMLYWATETIGSSFLPNYDLTQAGASRWILEKAKEWASASHVPAAFALSPIDPTHPPRAWAERFFNVQRWTEMPKGGHFAAMEEPELLAEDIRAFFRPLRDQTR
jgi:pimeloyl-ACP methyl ester carboxylesterase